MIEGHISKTFPCIRVKQPIGEFYIASIDKKTICAITDFDIRRVERERELETYLGIQRPLNKKRVKEITQYVGTIDACFPTAIIVAVPGVCVSFDETTNRVTLSNYIEPEEDGERVYYRKIARVLDGQHRIAALIDSNVEEFEMNVSIFIDMDIAEQGYLFSTVNLAQTKVNRSLAYDLFDLARARSPQRTCHNIAVALDNNKKSPFYRRIKRLGVATEGRYGETITQATFVESLIRYICINKEQQVGDRDLYMRGKKPGKANAGDLKKVLFRNMFIDEQDFEIADIVYNYFVAVKNKWPQGWDYAGSGIILNKANAFRAFMRFLKDAYLFLTLPGGVPSIEEFENKVFSRINLKDEDFNTDRFKHGAGGEMDIYRTLLEESKIEQ